MSLGRNGEQNSQTEQRRQPLQGLRVLDRTVEVGELCGRLLTDLGAEVVKVEPAGGSPARSMPPRALGWAFRNWNKFGVTDDRALVTGADVVLHSSVDDLQPAHPAQVVCSMTWFGRTGPYASRRGCDDVVVGMSGWLSQAGVPEKPPLLVPGAVGSDAASIVGLWAVLAALWQRRLTGRGQSLDVSALEAVIQVDTWSIANASNGAERRVRGGVQMYPTMATVDGNVKVVVMSSRQWRALFEWMGEPAALADPAFDQMMTRIMRREEIFAVLGPFLRDMTTEEAAEEAQRRGIVVTPINTPANILVDEHLLQRGALRDAEVAPGVRARVPVGFVEFDGVRLGHRVRAPFVGEHDGQLSWDSLRTVPSSVPAPAGGPLAGMRVLDFGQGGVGVQCGRVFADHGADVIKVESARYPDFMRLMGSNLTSPSFASSSRSKRSFGVNLKSPEGVDLVRRLAASADVVIENNSTGTVASLGLGWEDLHAINPSLVMLSSQLLGSTGPRAGWRGYGPSVQAYGGLLHLWAFPDGEGWPGSPSNFPDLLVGELLAAFGLAALWERERTGQGTHVDLSQAEVVANMLGDLLLAEALAPGSVGPDGNTDERGAVWGPFRCVGDEEWVVVCSATEVPELEAWCAQLAPDEVAARCQALGIPAARMAYPPDLLSDPHLAARGFLVSVDQPGIGPLRFDRQSYLATDMPLSGSRPAPALGEHTLEICHEELRLSETEIEALFAAGVLE
ncbi:MAG: CoA transferase [Acidimicrobiales bacterium]|jgi:crotonobetainyl-CoA:carnitine CoA-transferase CaiB-like acyl-CoA transferase